MGDHSHRLDSAYLSSQLRSIAGVGFFARNSGLMNVGCRMSM